jgi:exopolysaccharide production protein ExoZ
MEALPKTFSSVQALRGLAALAVVVYHGELGAHENNLGPISDFKGGESGVDLFFAISGFVMVISTARWWGDRTSWSPFLLRRLIRIAPLYWIFTALKILSLVVLPGAARHSILGWRLVIASFLFIPTWNEGHGGVVAPILPVGWTLCFEMFFYVLLALSLAVSKRPVRLVIVLLVSLVALSFLRPGTTAWGAPATLINLILLEFAFGMVIALAARGGHLLSLKPALGLAVVAILFLMIYPCPFNSFIATLAPDEKDSYRAILRGIPCALFLYAAVSLERPARRWLTGLPGLIGDASYSIYLSHTFVVPLLGILWLKWAWTGSLSAYALVAVCLVASTFTGILVHWFLEIPLLHYLNQKVHQPDPVGIRAPH